MTTAPGRLTLPGSAPSRLAALLLLLVVLGLAYAGLAAPYLAHVGAITERLDARADILARMRRIAEQPAPADDASAGAQLGRLLLTAGSEAQAVAQLQDRLKAIALDAGVDLLGVQVLPAVETAQLSRLTLRLRGTADIAAASRFLHAVESGAPALLVENLRLQSRTLRGPGAGSLLELQLDVAGFRVGAAS